MACQTFGQQHIEDLKPARTYDLMVSETERLKRILDNETHARRQAQSSLGTDLDAKAKQMENMTPEQRYQSRVQAYYKAKTAQK